MSERVLCFDALFVCVGWCTHDIGGEQMTLQLLRMPTLRLS